MEVLIAVAREQSFSRAAQSLHRTQPAVSQAIRRLEAELGEPLFDRSSKDGTPLPGRVLFDFAEQMLNLRQGASRDQRAQRPTTGNRAQRERVHRDVPAAGAGRVSRASSAHQG